jgi:hypothetical protein
MYVVRAERPLIMYDMVSFDPDIVVEQLSGIPVFARWRRQLERVASGNLDRTEVQSILSRKAIGDSSVDAGHKQLLTATKQIQNIIRQAGFDHIAYPNAVESRGTPSIITFSESQMKSTMAPWFSRRVKDSNYAAIPGAALLGAPEEKKNGD